MIAHISEDGRIQSVVDHLKNTAAICGSYASKIGLRHLGEIAGLVHDAGKCTEVFENYILSGDGSMKGKINHSSAGARYIYELFGEGADAEILIAQLVATAVVSHHGGLIDVIGDNCKNGIRTRLYPENKNIYYSEAIRNFTDVTDIKGIIREKAENAAQEITVVIRSILEKDPENFFFHIGLIQKFLFSCLIDADRYDTFSFSVGKAPEIKVLPENFWQEQADKIEYRLSQFNTDSYINTLRRRISDQCIEFSEKPCGIYRLYVPTGGGKTLSSLRFAVSHCKKYKKERIFYIIPFNTIIDQVSGVIKDIMGGEAVLEHHSNIVSDDERYSYYTQRWEHPVILTTMVQFLDTLFKGGTKSVRRFHTLCNSVIIFDEIQTLPPKCVHLFNSAVNFLNQFCNTTVVLCTATQPQLNAVKIPVRLSEEPDIVRDYTESFMEFKRTEIIDKTQHPMNVKELCGFISEQLKTKNTILVILNTKRSAAELYREVRSVNKNTVLLSTALCKAHRADVLERVKSAGENDKFVCVSTQLIEAGIDISVDCVIRALAGVDSIAQAAGRCNRNGEYQGLRQVYIVKPSWEDVSRLTEIREGQKAAELVLKEDNLDLLSPEAIEMYYKYYFYKRKDDMNYTVRSKKTSIYEMLSKNRRYWDAYAYSHPNEKLLVRQAFESAGNSFNVIEAETIGIAVPYKTGAEIILKLNSGDHVSEKYRIIKELRRYVVNVFEYEFKYLQKAGAVHFIEDVGIWDLDERYYSDEYGVVYEPELKLIMY